MIANQGNPHGNDVDLGGYFQDIFSIMGGDHNEQFKNSYLTLRDQVEVGSCVPVSKIDPDTPEAEKNSQIASIRRGVWMKTLGWEALMHLWWMYRISRTSDIIGLDNDIMRVIQTKMIGVANVVRGLNRLVYLAKKYPALADGISDFKNLQDLLNPNPKRSIKLVHLMNLLKTSTLTGQATAFSFMGRALSAYTLMNDVKDLFAPALEVAGEFDALYSMADVHGESAQKPVKWCFVEFVDSDTPYLELTNFWNPIVPVSKVVPENITFGSKVGLSNMLITGPHGCGKSTIMKAQAYCVVLAQVFGLAPAESAKITPFTKIHVYMNVKEDLVHGLSTFMAEQDRLETIKLSLKKLTYKDKAFTIMDEVFKGTMESEGGRRLYDFVKDIAPIANNISLIATHFEEPTKAEDTTNKRFRNYFVELLEPTPGNFVRTFRLISGKHPWWFTDVEKRKRFIEWLRKLESSQKN